MIFGLDFPLGVQTLLVTLSLMRKIECAEMCRNAAHVLQLCWNNFRLTEICMNMQHIYSTIAAHVLYTDSTCITYMQHIYSTIAEHVLYIDSTFTAYMQM